MVRPSGRATSHVPPLKLGGQGSGGRRNRLGVFGVELFVLTDGSILFNEVSPRPHDTGMVTMITQDLSQFALHARAVLGLPIPNIVFHGAGASRAVVVEGDSDRLSLGNLDKVLEQPDTQMRFFGKPEVHGHRRMAVLLARGLDVTEAREKTGVMMERLNVKLWMLPRINERFGVVL